MAKREVTIKIGVEGQAASSVVKGLRNAFDDLNESAVRAGQGMSGVTDRNVFTQADKIGLNLVKSLQTQGLNQYRDVLRQFQPELKQLSQALRQGSFDQADYNRRVGNLSPAIQKALADFKQLGQGIKEVGSEFDSSESSFDWFKRFAGGEFAGNLAADLFRWIKAQIVELVTEALSASAQLEQAITNVSTIATLNTQKVSDSLLVLSTQIPQTAAQMADGLYEIYSSLDVTETQALKLVETFSKGAVAAQTDAQTFGSAISGVLNAYKKDVSEAGHISDVFFNTVKLGVVNGRELAANLGGVTQSAKLAGVSFDELGGLIAGVTKEGGPAAENINNLQNFLRKLPTKEAKEGLRDIGVELVDLNTGKFRPVLDVLTELKTKLASMTDEQRAGTLQKIFPDLQAQAGIQTLLSQLDFVKRAVRENAAAVGVAEEAYRKMSNTAAAQFELLKNSVGVFLISWGDIVTKSELAGAAIRGMSQALLFMAQNKTVIVAFTVAVVGLAAAFNATSVAAGITSARIALVAYMATAQSVIPVIVNVGRAMIGLSTTFATAGATAVAVTGGWFALIAIIGTLVYLLVQYATAVKEVALADGERTAALRHSITATQDDVKWLKEQKDSLDKSSEAKERYNNIINALSTGERANLRLLGDEKSQREFVISTLEKQIAKNDELIGVQLRLAANAAQSKLTEASQADAELARLAKKRREYQTLIEQGYDIQTVFIAEAVSTLDLKEELKSLDFQYESLSKSSEEARKVAGEMEAILVAQALATGKSGAELIAHYKISQRSAQEQANLARQVDESVKKIREQEKAALAAGTAIKNYANEVVNIKLPDADVLLTYEGIVSFAKQLDEQLKKGLDSGHDYWEMLRQLSPAFNQLNRAINAGSFDKTDLQRRFALLPESIKKALSEVAKMGKSVEQTQNEQKKTFDDGKRAVDSYKSSVEDLYRELKFFGNNSRKAAVEQEYQKLSTQQLTQAQREQLKALYEQKIALADDIDKKEASAEATQNIKRKIEELKNQTYELERAQTISNKATIAYEIFLRQTGGAIKYTKDELDKLRKAFEDFFVAQDDSQRQEKIKSSAKALSDSITQEGRQIERLQNDWKQFGGKDKTPLDMFLERIEDMPDLKLQVGQLNELSAVIKGMESAEPIKLAELFLGILKLNNLDIPTGKLGEISALFAQIAIKAKGWSAQSKENQVAATYSDLLADLNGKLYQYNELTEREIVLKRLEKAGITDINDARAQEALRLADVIDQMKEAEKARQAWQAMKNEVQNFFERAINATVENGWKGLMNFLVNEFKRALIRMAAEWAASKFMELLTGKSSSNQNSSGGILGSLLSSIFGIFSKGKSGNAGAERAGNVSANTAKNFSHAVSSVTSNASQSNLIKKAVKSAGVGGIEIPKSVSEGLVNLPRSRTGQMTPQQAASSVGGKGSLSGVGNFLGTLAPTLGLTFGTILGGQSVGGQILGGAGGLVLGGTLAALLAPGALTGLGLSAGLVSGIAAAAPFLLPIAAVALIGSYFLGRNKKRRQEEGIRNQAMLDAFSQLDQLIDSVRRNKTDGASALSQAQQIRSSYLQRMSQLKDSKTRRIALADVSRIDGKISTLKAVADAQAARQARADLFAPTFADGGKVNRQKNLQRLRERAEIFAGDDNARWARKVLGWDGARMMPFNGRVPGVYDRKDDFWARLTGNEVVLTPYHWRPLQPYLKQRKVPGFAEGGFTGDKPLSLGNSNQSQSNSQPIVNVEIYMQNTIGVDEKTSAEIVKVGAKTEDGKEAIVGSVITHVEERGMGNGLTRTQDDIRRRGY